MSPKKQRRLAFAAALLVAGVAGAALIVVALRDNVLFFYSPSDLVANPVSPGQTFRIGGLVETGSVVRDQGLEITFKVTDGKASVPVRYVGALPDLFREGQGVVALGSRQPDGVFTAREVLAKHDETYMPPEVVDALKRSGRWEEGAPAKGGL
jgi:cytochrome c-type biogenesis protein CcmE